MNFDGKVATYRSLGCIFVTMNGSVIRIHDVVEMVDVVKIANALRREMVNDWITK